MMALFKLMVVGHMIVWGELIVKKDESDGPSVYKSTYITVQVYISVYKSTYVYTSVLISVQV